MRNFILGICAGTIGIASLSAISDIIINKAELIKAKIGVKITKYNTQINEINMPQIKTGAIGFATTNVEEDNYDI